MVYDSTVTTRVTVSQSCGIMSGSSSVCIQLVSYVYRSSALGRPQYYLVDMDAHGIAMDDSFDNSIAQTEIGPSGAARIDLEAGRAEAARNEAEIRARARKARKKSSVGEAATGG